MKKHSVLLVLIPFLFLISCSNPAGPGTGTSPGVPDAPGSVKDVYILGTQKDEQLNEVPCYWINSVVYSFPEPPDWPDADFTNTFMPSDIIAYSENVYVTGSYGDPDNQEDTRACIWDEESNQIKSLSLPQNASSCQAYGLAEANGQLYILGTYENTLAKTVACYWNISGGDSQDIATLDNDIEFYSFNVLFTGSVLYALGSRATGVPEIEEFVCWKLGPEGTKAYVLQQPVEENDLFWEIEGITLLGDFVYVTGSMGTPVSLDEEEFEVMCWKISKNEILDSISPQVLIGKDSVAYQTTASGGDLYIAGGEFSGDAAPKPCHWKLTGGAAPGEKKLLPLPGAFSFGLAMGIIADSGNIYTMGSLGDEEAVCYWINQNPPVLIDNLCHFFGFCVK